MFQNLVFEFPKVKFGFLNDGIKTKNLLNTMLSRKIAMKKKLTRLLAYDVLQLAYQTELLL
ncbi:hypothetical protein BTO06_01430 [Tenacibaculum sp. SZ-18]|nr:hypothetical protein BTO06_01430 [Tenacibaculum sp. SZ-18]